MKDSLLANSALIQKSSYPVRVSRGPLLQHAGSSGECESCKRKRLSLQRSAINNDAPNIAPPIVHRVLHSPGRPLDSATRAYIELRFDHDFSRVQVHTDAETAEPARVVNALVYTVERDVVFGAGQFAPGASGGKQ